MTFEVSADQFTVVMEQLTYFTQPDNQVLIIILGHHFIALGLTLALAELSDSHNWRKL